MNPSPQPPSTRAEHLAWCKRRALQYLPHDPAQCFASMASDLTRHPETADHVGIKVGAMMMFAGLWNAREARRWVEGFN